MSARPRTNANNRAPVRHAVLRESLERRRRDLFTRVREAMRAARAAAQLSESVSTDVADDSVIESSIDVDMTLVQLASETLRHLDQALERLRQGNYGDCADCGVPIAAARLDAVPFAIRCVGCESARENASASRQMAASRASCGDYSFFGD